MSIEELAKVAADFRSRGVRPCDAYLYLTPCELSGNVNVPLRTIYHLMKTRQLGYIELHARFYLIPVSEWTAYLAWRYKRPSARDVPFGCHCHNSTLQTVEKSQAAA